MHKLRVWDLPTRTFHWALLVLVVGLFVSGKIGGNAMVWHFRMGYGVLSLLLFRIIWGIVGGHWSRFLTFIYSPKSIINYLRGKGSPQHSIGHSPTGAFAVFGLIGILLLQVVSGLFSDDEIAFTGPLAHLASNDMVSQLTDYHQNWGYWIIIGIVALHILAIFFYALVKKHALVPAMLHGDKDIPDNLVAPASRDNAPSRLVALAIFAICCGLSVWISKLS